jgi:hypothetical protein
MLLLLFGAIWSWRPMKMATLDLKKVAVRNGEYGSMSPPTKKGRSVMARSKCFGQN